MRRGKKRGKPSKQSAKSVVGGEQKSIFRFRRQNGNKAVRVPASAEGNDFRKIRSQRKRAEKLNKAVNFTKSRIRLTIAIFVVAVLIGVLAAFLVFLHNSPVLRLKEIVVLNNEQIAASDIRAEVDYLIGKSMVGFDTTLVEYQLLERFPYLKGAYVRKIIPDRLEIEVVERFPILAYVNMAGAVLVDDERVVVNVLAANTLAPFSSDEILILDGFGDPNSKRVEDKYLSQIEDEEERNKVKWEEVALEDKQQVLNQLREDYKLRVETQFGQYLPLVGEAGFASLPVVLEANVQVFDEGEIFPKGRFEISRAIWQYFGSRGLVVTKLLWQTEFNIQAELPNGGKVLFTSSKDINSQLQALESVRKVENLNKVQLVDLRSELVSVK